jgi:hypothetical protein
MYCRNTFLPAPRLTKFSSVYVLFTPQNATKSYALAMGFETTTGFQFRTGVSYFLQKTPAWDL